MPFKLIHLACALELLATPSDSPSFTPPALFCAPRGGKCQLERESREILTSRSGKDKKKERKEENCLQLKEKKNYLLTSVSFTPSAFLL